jgi:hypothetical protein
MRTRPKPRGRFDLDGHNNQAPGSAAAAFTARSLCLRASEKGLVDLDVA